MSELTKAIKQELKDKEARFIYDDDLLNSYIATQIKVLREQRGWTQQVLAEQAGMKQERISVLEDVNYSSWTAKVLRRLAQAFDLRLTIKFEEFNTFFKDFEGIKPELLEKRSFEDDPAFKDEEVAQEVEAEEEVEPTPDREEVFATQGTLPTQARSFIPYEEFLGKRAQSEVNREKERAKRKAPAQQNGLSAMAAAGGRR